MSQEGEFLRLRRGDFFFSGEGFCLSCEEDFFCLQRGGSTCICLEWDEWFFLLGGGISLFWEGGHFPGE